MALWLLFKFFLSLAVALCYFHSTNAQGLKVGFYSKTCPHVEAIVQKTTASFISRAPSLSGPLLMMHFHDCFVREIALRYYLVKEAMANEIDMDNGQGCDGSVLLNSTKGNQAEKEAVPNQSLRGFHVIDAVKDAVENECPGVVSCADVLALVARDVVSMVRGPHWKVPTGRRDGLVSRASEVNLPAPSFNIKQLKASFCQKGLSVKDLVVLSGGHTIGIAHCPTFSNRIYNFTGKGDTDPTLDPNYIAQLRIKCKQGDVTSFVQMDPGSSKIFDTDYYKVVSKRRGLFQSDAALLDDDETKAYIGLQINLAQPSFFNDFGVSMVKMGNIGVLTGKAGEIRKKCSVIN